MGRDLIRADDIDKEPSPDLGSYADVAFDANAFLNNPVRRCRSGRQAEQYHFRNPVRAEGATAGCSRARWAQRCTASWSLAVDIHWTSTRRMGAAAVRGGPLRFGHGCRLCPLRARTGHVATITYNRPDVLNAVNGEMRRDLNGAFARFRDEGGGAGWAIVTGAGRAFCAGADLRDGAGCHRRDSRGSFWEKPTVNSFESGWEIYKPVIAAVNGHCLGYGLTLVTRCDFVLASDRARFGYPEAALGIPAMVGAIRLPQKIGWSECHGVFVDGGNRSTPRRRPGSGLVWQDRSHDRPHGSWPGNWLERLVKAVFAGFSGP